MQLSSKNKELEQLKIENARLNAALNEYAYECQRLEIINSNLEIQLNQANRELAKNIEVLQSLKSEIDLVVDRVNNYGIQD